MPKEIKKNENLKTKVTKNKDSVNTTKSSKTSPKKGNSLNKGDLVKAVCLLTKSRKIDVVKIINTTIEKIKEVIREPGQSVKIVNFCTFSSRIKNPRLARNPKSKDKTTMVYTKAKRVPSARMSKAIFSKELMYDVPETSTKNSAQSVK